MNQNVPTPVKASWRIVAAVAMVALAWPDMALAQRTSRSQFSSRTQPQTSTARQVPQTPRGLSRPGGPRRGDGPVVGPSGEGIEARGSFDEEGFVGRDAEDVRETFDRLSPRERRGAMFDMMLENLNEMRRAQERWQEQRRQPPPVRIRLQPAFRSPPRLPEVVAANVETRFG